jgi:hypothetical protein
MVPFCKSATGEMVIVEPLTEIENGTFDAPSDNDTTGDTIVSEKLIVTGVFTDTPTAPLVGLTDTTVGRVVSGMIVSPTVVNENR